MERVASSIGSQMQRLQLKLKEGGDYNGVDDRLALEPVDRRSYQRWLWIFLFNNSTMTLSAEHKKKSTRYL
jgi:hypothetical protein